MNLQILSDQKDAIEGFAIVQVKDGECKDIEQVIDSSCELVVLDGAMDHLEYKDSIELMAMATKKVRLKGELVIRGICLEKLYRDYKSEEITIEELNNTLKNIKSIQNYKDIISALMSQNFSVDTISYVNSFYEIHCSRKN
jgi:hypothetical protein